MYAFPYMPSYFIVPSRTGEPMPVDAAPHEGQILRGSFFSEPMRVETIRAGGDGTWVLGLVGVSSERFRKVTLSAAAAGSILLTPNERRMAEDRCDCYWLYVVTNCAADPVLQEPLKDPARLGWHEVKKVAHYYLSVDALRQPMKVREDLPPFGSETS
jgi:hypothetical protein